MHEVATMRGVVQTILEVLHQSGSSRVTRVELTLDTAGHLTEEVARQLFQVCTKDTPIENASLVISWIPATFQCLACLHCFKSYHAAERVTCPKCDDIALEIEQREICFVSAIDVVSDEEQTMPEQESQRSWG